MSGATTFGLLLPLAVCIIAAALACGSSNMGPSPSSTTSSSSPSRRCGGTVEHIPFITQLTLPTNLPKELRLVTACGFGDESTPQDTEFFYASDNGKLIVAVLNGPGIVPVQQKDRSTVQFGDLLGYVSNDAEPDGTTFYSVEFEKNGRAYMLGASIGPGNNVTPDDVNTVAQSIAEN